MTSPSEKILLSVKDLSTHFKNNARILKANEHLNFDIYNNEVFALVGESGSGKSVSAKSILGLLPYPKAFHPNGSIRFNTESSPSHANHQENVELLGADEKFMQSLRGNEISIIFQEPLSALNPLHKIEKQLAEVISNHREISKASLKKECLKLIEDVQLKHPERVLKSHPHELSGGQLQRIMIAIAIANRPKLLIADEPTTALDVTIQKEILDLLIELKNTLNMSILLITHDLRIVKHYANRVAVMKNGQIIENTSVTNLFNRPQHEYTNNLIDASHLKESIKNTIHSQQTDDYLLEVDDFSVFIKQTDQLFKPAKRKFLSNNISFKLKQGQTLGLVGESGSGKTTTILGLLGLMQTTGNAIFKGVELTTLSTKEWQSYRKEIQIVFQDPFSSLSPRMSVEQIICEGLRIHENLSDTELHQSAKRLIVEVGLDVDMLNRYPHEFSGGQRQRLAIARAIALNPLLLILDEPTSALDKPIQAQIINLLESLQKKYQLSYIFISHDLNLIRHICDHVVVLKEGEMVEQGPAESLFSNPSNQYTQTLIDSILA